MTDASQRPAAEGIAPGHFAPSPVEAGHIAPCPRRIRAMHGDKWALDSSEVTYYWQHPYYPQYLIPMADIDLEVVPDEALKTIDGTRADQRLVSWGAIDRWFEEDEEVFVHPRSPYTRADAIRSSRRVRLDLNGVVLAEASDCVIVFETGLPRATTSIRRLLTGRCSRRATPSPSARTKARLRSTGTWSSQAKLQPTSPGATTFQHVPSPRSPGWWRSTTRSSGSLSIESNRKPRRPGAAGQQHQTDLASARQPAASGC